MIGAGRRRSSSPYHAVRSSSLLARARHAGVRHVDVVVVTRPSAPTLRAVDVLMSRIAVRRTVTAPGIVATAHFRVEVTPGPKGIEARVYSLRSLG